MVECVHRKEKSGGNEGFFVLEFVTCGFDPLFGIFSANAGRGIQDLDVELSGALDDLTALLDGDGAGDLGGELVVVHQEKLEVLDIVDDELKEVVGQHVAGGSGRAISNASESAGTTEATAHAVIDTLGLTVGGLLYSVVGNIKSNQFNKERVQDNAGSGQKLSISKSLN